tara:strand:+ start:537 stop:761 length:225 start_codon:yes stop_codon:yes gene_type:complete
MVYEKLFSIFKSNSGQALVEYMLIFSLFALIAFGLTNSFNNLMGNFTTSFSVILSQHLSIGVCETECFFNGYGN